MVIMSNLNCLDKISKYHTSSSSNWYCTATCRCIRICIFYTEYICLAGQLLPLVWRAWSHRLWQPSAQVSRRHSAVDWAKEKKLTLATSPLSRMMHAVWSHQRDIWTVWSMTGPCWALANVGFTISLVSLGVHTWNHWPTDWGFTIPARTTIHHR